MADDIRQEYDINVGHDVQPAPEVAVVAKPANAAEALEAKEEFHEAEQEVREQHERVNLVSHSTLFYWWPIWAVGFVFAAITWFNGEAVSIGRAPPEMIHPNNGLGLVYVLVVFAVLLITNVVLRGLASGMVILSALLIAVVLAWLDLWDDLLQLLPHVNVHMNFGFYVLLSTLVFIVWALTTFIFDRLTYWRIDAGQVTKEHLVGGGEESYDTTGLVLEERHDDLFRHWILGLGSGDLRMKVAGQMHDLPNVLFANPKVAKIQRLIKRKPE